MAPNITQDEYGNVTFDGPDAVDVFRLVSIKHALRLELNTGLKHGRVNVKAVAEQALGQTFPRSRKGKEACLAAIEKRLEDIKEVAAKERARREAIIAARNKELGYS